MDYYLDSNALIDLIRKKPNLLQFILNHSSDTFIITSITYFEVFFGFVNAPVAKKLQNHPHRTDLLQRIKNEEKIFYDIVKDLKCHDFDSRAAKITAEIKKNLQLKGITVPFPDLLIAGIIKSYEGQNIVSRDNNHFDKIEGLSRYSY
jgi:predicted nucleic acid-binding protein